VKKPQPRRPSGSRHSSAATSPTSWIGLDDAHHLRRRELSLEHRPDRVAALDRLLRHLMIDGILMIERGEPVRVPGVEPLHPGLDKLLRRHRAVMIA
jgi:hypothetical protein